MKKLILFLLSLSLVIPVYSDSAPSTNTRLEPETPVPVPNPNKAPQDFSWHEIYCTVNGTQATVYSPTSVCGEIIAIDTMTGATLCDATTDLGSGFTLSIIPSHPVEIYVTIDGISYWCEI